LSVITSGKKKNHEHFKTSKTCISLRIYQWLDYQSYVDVCANINDPWLDYQSHPFRVQLLSSLKEKIIIG
jgi:hypothetical protein